MDSIIGGAAGLAFGSAAAFINCLITKKIFVAGGSRSGKGELMPIMGVNALRMLINISALAAVFLLREWLPWPPTAVAVGVCIGLSAVSLFFIFRLVRRDA